MIITIFGATGMVGKAIIKLALAKDYVVKAFGRNVFTSGFAEHKNLELLPGALFDEGPVYHAIQGSDAVLSALGGSIDGIDKTRSLGMKHIIAQMQKASVKRIIAIGGKGQLNSPDEDMLMDSAAYPKKMLAVSMEHFKAYQYLKASGLDWTFVCPPQIVDAPVTGLYHTEPDHPPVPDNNKINAGDLAMFMLNELERNEFIHKRVGISN